MKKIVSSLVLGGFLFQSNILADEIKGLNVIINSSNVQTQMMAMVLSNATLSTHKKEVNITLCSDAANLALKEYKSADLKKADGTTINPKNALMGLMKGGAKVSVCPLFLPNITKDVTALIDGITVAKPPVVAGDLLNSAYSNISF
jgi:hypothetical protein